MVGDETGEGVPVEPRHLDTWGKILTQSPQLALAPGGWTLDKIGRRLLGVKDLVFIGSSADDLRGFPPVARQRAGFALHLVQRGQEPSDWRPTSTVGPGCAQIRVHDAADAYRVTYVASIGNTVYVLHCSQKQGPQTAASDLEIGKRYERMSELIGRGRRRDHQAL